MTRPTLRGLADRLGVGHPALSKAVREGRLTAGITMERGRVVVVDADAAAAQWESSKPDDDGSSLTDYWTAKARREHALADMAEMERDERRGELVPVEEARADVINKFTIVKTRILGVPSRLAQRMPNAVEVVPIVEALLREALEELAVDDDAG